jgi:hypothetical protein
MPAKMPAKEPSPSLTPVSGGWDPPALFGAGEHAFESWALAASALAQEMAQFVQSRLQEDMKSWARLASCRDPGEAFQCQCRFAEKAVADYLDEAGKLSALAMTLSTKGIAPQAETAPALAPTKKSPIA